MYLKQTNAHLQVGKPFTQRACCNRKRRLYDELGPFQFDAKKVSLTSMHKTDERAFTT